VQTFKNIGMTTRCRVLKIEARKQTFEERHATVS